MREEALCVPKPACLPDLPVCDCLHIYVRVIACVLRVIACVQACFRLPVRAGTGHRHG